jgi:hypothetical protein
MRNQQGSDFAHRRKQNSLAQEAANQASRPEAVRQTGGEAPKNEPAEIYGNGTYQTSRLFNFRGFTQDVAEKLVADL